MPRYTFMRPCMHYPCSFQAVVGDRGARRRAILTARATHDQYPTKKGPLYFFGAAQKLITPPPRATARRPTLAARSSVFCLMTHDGRESPLSCTHTTHRGGFQRTDGSWAIQSWDPPLSLGRLMSRGSQKLSPRSNYYTTNLYGCHARKSGNANTYGDT